jgi:hypothetical protein
MRVLLGLIMVFMASVASADVVGKIVGVTQDDNGSIVVQTAYFLDGTNVPSRYPQMADGTYYWQTRYTFQNFDGMDAKAIEARIQQDVDAFAQSLIAKKFTAETNASINLTPLIGKQFTSTTAEIQVSPTKAYVVDTAGTATVKAIAVEEVTP